MNTDMLNDFTLETRREALKALLSQAQFAPLGTLFNMHCHSFFSYNADGWSPSRIAWECRQRGLTAAALCDFDVLDGLEEFLAAGRSLALRTAVHLETRSYVREQATVDISSPGEPGVAYIMGCGFTAIPKHGTPQALFLEKLRQGAQERNHALIARINGALPAIALDYTQDVVPLTPKGVATERHIIRAYVQKSLAKFSDGAQRAAFWAPLLKCDTSSYPAIEADVPKMEELVRNALAKRGGIGYIQPTEKTFPLANDFLAWVRSCGAIPTIAWLDGTSGGEVDPEQLLELMTHKGAAALNIIPDRNWNLKKPEEAARKQANLEAIVKGCVKRDLPINIGTEMNKGGLPFVDDITGPVLSKYAAEFTQGMQIMIGQTLLGLYAQAPYLSERIVSEYKDLVKRNAFFAKIGAAPAVTEAEAEKLLEAGPAKAFTLLVDRCGRSTSTCC
jgi:hypothetical protein